MLCKPLILVFFSAHLMISIVQEHQCKIYIKRFGICSPIHETLVRTANRALDQNVSKFGWAGILRPLGDATYKISKPKALWFHSRFSIFFSQWKYDPSSCDLIMDGLEPFEQLLTKRAIWAATWDFQQCGMCDQQSLRSACTYAQSDQSICLLLDYSMIVKLLTEHHLEFLSLKGGCSLHLTNYHIVGNHMSRLIYGSFLWLKSCQWFRWRCLKQVDDGTQWTYNDHKSSPAYNSEE